MTDTDSKGPAKEMTAGEASTAEKELETAAATLLGRLLFEFSRLDVALGLCLVWSDEGRSIEALTVQVTRLTFHQKLGTKQVRPNVDA